MQTDLVREKVKGKELRYFCIFTMAILFGAAFLFASPIEIAEGMVKIVRSRDALITDYFVLAGYGAAFFNAGLMMLVTMVLIEASKIPYTGFTLLAFFVNLGFGFWGKNPVNIIPIILGTWIYARLQSAPMARYIFTALFATCMAPFVTEMVYILPFPYFVNVLLAVAMGVFIGFILPPLSMHTSSMHMGYCLTNVGFASGVLAFIIYCVLRAFGITSEPVFLWKEGRHPAIATGLLLYFAATFLYGLWIESGRVEGIGKIMRHPGRAVADFVIMDSAGTTLMNMGMIGLAGEAYIFLIGGDLSGPILGCILSLLGFGAFGAHLKNYLPLMVGVFLSTLFTENVTDAATMQVASLFVVAIAPIAGQFGVIAGVVTGILHATVVVCTSALYGGLNLYNNGFAAGWVAIVMIPFMEGFMRQFKEEKQKEHRR